jgi:hypothetical protein
MMLDGKSTVFVRSVISSYFFGWRYTLQNIVPTRKKKNGSVGFAILLVLDGVCVISSLLWGVISTYTSLFSTHNRVLQH